MTEKSPARFLFRSSLLGAFIMFAGWIAFEPNKDVPDWSASIIFGLLALPSTVLMLTLPIVLVLRFAFQPLHGLLYLKNRPSPLKRWIALIAVVLPTMGVSALIDGATLGHVFSAGVALSASCLLYAKKNRFA